MCEFNLTSPVAHSPVVIGAQPHAVAARRDLLQVGGLDGAVVVDGNLVALAGAVVDHSQCAGAAAGGGPAQRRVQGAGRGERKARRRAAASNPPAPPTARYLPPHTPQQLLRVGGPPAHRTTASLAALVKFAARATVPSPSCDDTASRCRCSVASLLLDEAMAQERCRQNYQATDLELQAGR